MKSHLLIYISIIFVLGTSTGVLCQSNHNASASPYKKKPKSFHELYPIQDNQFYTPTKDDLERLEKDSQIADWNYYLQYSKKPIGITNIKLVGFENVQNGKRISLNTSDKKHIKMFQTGFSLEYMYRLPVSDLSLEGSPFKPDMLLGTIYLKRKGENIQIGVGSENFHLDTSTTGPRTAFKSWFLSKVLDDVLFDLTGKHLDQATFDKLSGEEWLSQQQSRFEEMTKDKTKEATP